MGDSRLYTSFEISSILSDSSMSNIKHTKLYSINQIDSSKVDSLLIENLNQEMINLGYQSILNSREGELDLPLLVKNSLDLIKALKRSNSQIEKIQDHCVKLGQESDVYYKRHEALVEEHEGCAREVKLNKEKLRQMQTKLDEANKTIKTLNDQVKKCQAQKEQSEKLFKNERTKVEKEREKLKTRLQALLNARVKEFQTIDMSSSLLASSSKTNLSPPDSPNKKMDAYGELIKDYDHKLREITIEINEVKTFVCHVFGSLDNLLEENSAGTGQREPDDTRSVEEIIKLPFDSIYKELIKRLDAKLKLLSSKINSTLFNHDYENLLGGLSLIDPNLATPITPARQPHEQQQLNSSSHSSFVSNDC